MGAIRSFEISLTHTMPFTDGAEGLLCGGCRFDKEERYQYSVFSRTCEKCDDAGGYQRTIIIITLLVFLVLACVSIFKDDFKRLSIKSAGSTVVQVMQPYCALISGAVPTLPQTVRLELLGKKKLCLY